jgi:hypothetical protein
MSELDPTMLISWDDIGRPKTAGTYYCERLGLRVDVQDIHVETWIDRPNAKARLLRYGTLDADDNYRISRMEA